MKFCYPKWFFQILFSTAILSIMHPKIEATLYCFELLLFVISSLLGYWMTYSTLIFLETLFQKDQ